MNNYKTDYITEWTSNDKLPPIGISCPACNKGTIEENSFTSKKGEYFKSVLCKKCRKKWIVSKGRATYPETKPQQQATNTGMQIMYDEFKEDMKKYYMNLYKKLLEIEKKIK